MADDLARLHGVTVRYDTPAGDVVALDGIDVAFPSASSTAIVGRSGSGKSTLVSVLGLLRRPTSGSYVLAGHETTTMDDAHVTASRGSSIGVVFQAFHLEPTLTVRDNVLFASFFGGRSRRARAQLATRAAALLDLLGVGDLQDRRPNSLSGGQRQRVAIARAMLDDPLLLLADEPTGNLDEETADAVADALLALPEAYGTTVVVVTHDLQIAQRADRVATLSMGRLDEVAEPPRAARPSPTR